MSETWLSGLQQAGFWVAWAFVWLSCLTGVALSCLSISGTWLVALATIVALLLTPDNFPGWVCVVAFLLVSAAVEGLEWVAGSWGVKQRGGSNWGGVAALVGGLLGMVLGMLIPIPVVGSLIGMILGSFVLTFVVEHRRLSHVKQAASIAWGAVVGRAAIIVAKVVCTLGMIGILVIGLLRA